MRYFILVLTLFSGVAYGVDTEVILKPSEWKYEPLTTYLEKVYAETIDDPHLKRYDPSKYKYKALTLSIKWRF